ncbi:MAG: hypothetical protein JXB44_12340 [Calditrichaceae bacterium]|nr:hypothetical protein [Calditrichaceae bacterium]
MQILNGRYGPYVTDGKTNGRIPKHLEPEALTLEECREILEQSKNKPSRIRRRKKS